MQAWILGVVNAFGYFGVILLILTENIFPPIPSEVILTFGGFMTTYSKLTVPGVVISATLGSTLGAVLLYYIGRLLTPRKLEKILQGKTGKLLHFKPEDVDKALAWFQERGPVSVFICRCVPIVRSLISIPAGMTCMSFKPFLLLTIAGSAIWNILLVSLGAAAGSSWERITEITHTYKETTILIFFVLAGGFLLSLWKKKRKSRI